MKITVMGSGTSHGIPVVGCDCPVCASPDSRDKRTRASLYIEGEGGEKAVIDTGPEFRLQAVRTGIKALDAVFLTHAHADHIHGLDDVRPLTYRNALPVYGSPQTIAEMEERFSYVFKTTQRGGGKPRLAPSPLEMGNSVRAGGLVFTPVPVKHGELDIYGWKIAEDGRSALYLTDTSAIPGDSMRIITKEPRPELLVIGGLRMRPHETHFSFEEALSAALETGARRVYLTHICHDFCHKDIAAYCETFKKEHNAEKITMEPSYDGLVLNV